MPITKTKCAACGFDQATEAHPILSQVDGSGITWEFLCPDCYKSRRHALVLIDKEMAEELGKRTFLVVVELPEAWDVFWMAPRAA